MLQGKLNDRSTILSKLTLEIDFLCISAKFGDENVHKMRAIRINVTHCRRCTSRKMFLGKSRKRGRRLMSRRIREDIKVPWGGLKRASIEGKVKQSLNSTGSTQENRVRETGRGCWSIKLGSADDGINAQRQKAAWFISMEARAFGTWNGTMN